MKTGNAIKQILIYGDSLVFGKQSGANVRLASNVRFTGVLQDLLGDGFEVIEEGLRGRMLSGENPFFPERNGLQQFGPIVGSHLPVNVVVIALGTNDSNQNPSFDARVFAHSLNNYMSKLKDWAEFLGVTMPKVLVVLPPEIDETHYDEGTARIFGAGANERVQQLRQELNSVAEGLDLPVLDASQHCSPAAQDGIHLDLENNRKLAEALHAKLVDFVQ